MKSVSYFLIFLLLSAPSFASANQYEKELNDTVDVAAGLPLSVDDAGTQTYQTWSSQFATHFQHGGAEANSFTVSPEIQYGIFQNTEFSLTLPYTLQRIEGNHGDNIQTGLKYNFLPETNQLPGLSVEQDINFPTAEDAAGLQLTTQFFLTKHILPQYGTTAFYLNGNWTRFSHIDSDDRRNAFFGAVGFSHSITRHTAIVADLVEQQEAEKNKNDTLAEIGLRRFINKDLILSFGTGTGLNRDAPDFEFNAGLEYGF
jgi:hypothetical protein